MAQTVVLNWYAHNPRWVRGLRRKLSKKHYGDLMSGKVDQAIDPTFTTMRLGEKWANKLHVGQRIAISVSDDESKPNVIGYAIVESLKKIRLCNLEDADIASNIGAQKDRGTILKALKTVYGHLEVHERSVVSIIRLMPWH